MPHLSILCRLPPNPGTRRVLVATKVSDVCSMLSVSIEPHKARVDLRLWVLPADSACRTLEVAAKLDHEDFGILMVTV